MKRKKEKAKKRKYKTPRLEKFGNINSVVLAKGGARRDGRNKPATRVAAAGAPCW